jgi:hypothetical protein
MTITIKKRGYWCLRVVYTLCQGLESDGRNFLAAIVHYIPPIWIKNHTESVTVRMSGERNELLCKLGFF